MSLFRKHKQNTAVNAPCISSDAAARFAPLMTGQLVALYKRTKETSYHLEYLRRLEQIGFAHTQAENLFLFESMILKHDSVPILCDPNYLHLNYFDLQHILLPEPKEYYILHQMFLCSEITKIWDEAEYRFHANHEQEMPVSVWEEIFRLSRYGGGELFVEYLMSMASATETPFELLQRYFVAEQGLLFKYKWNPKANEIHPYRSV